MSRSTDERQPLLHEEDSHASASHSWNGPSADNSGKHVIKFDEGDPEHPRNWSSARKMVNVVIVASMSMLSPFASAAYAPATSKIADELQVDTAVVITATTGFVIGLGIGPLLLAPLSETFGRRPVYLACFVVFSVLQIPAAVAQNIATFTATRALAGFFGSVGIANGGGTISDMYEPSQRAGVFGVYLLGPILGPTIGPLVGAIIVQFLSWRWIFWVMLIMSAVVTVASMLFLKESYAPAILAKRKKDKERNSSDQGPFTFEGEDHRPLGQKVRQNCWRPLRILCTQPVVMVMATYQSLLWSCNYSLLTQFERIWSNEPYNFESWQVGLTYLPMAVGFVTSALFIIPRIDDVFNCLSKANGGEKPEYRQPLANIGAVLIPPCLLAFAWMVEYRLHWAIVFILFPFGLGSVTIFNCTQNYYIDAFEKYAASAIAAGALFRSLVGGIVPVLMPTLVDSVGYGWAFSVFGLFSVALAPSPLLFYRYGPALREKFKIDL